MLAQLDGEIREVEARIVRERDALVELATDYGVTLRDRAVSAKSLAAIAAVGFAVAELLHPARAARPAKNAGLLAAVVGAVIPLARTRYGMWALAQMVQRWRAHRAVRDYPPQPADFELPRGPVTPP
jgi:hypothetical protein